MEVTFEQAHAYFVVRLSEPTLPSKDKITAHCPFHGLDRNPSLEINLAKGGVWKCWAGSCNRSGGIFQFEKEMFGMRDGKPVESQELWDRIYKISGVKPAPNSGGSWQLGPVVATYKYTNADGKLLFEKRRHQRPGEPKDFTQRAPKDGGSGWVYSLAGVEKVLYRLPDLRVAEVAFCCEGEKDTDCLRAALGGTETVAPTVLDRQGKHRAAAVTCNFDGAGKWREEYNKYFAGRHVAILAHNDEAGRLHAEDVARGILPVALTVKIVHLAGLAEKGDVHDYLEQRPIADLLDEVTKARRYQHPVPAEVVSTPFFESPEAHMRRAGSLGIEWHMPRVVHKGSRGLIVAAPKAGKSMIGLDLALALSSGQSWLGLQPPTPVRMAVVSREDSPVLTMTRLEDLSRGRGLDMHSLENLHLNTFVQRGSFAIDKDEDLRQLCEGIKAEGIQIVLCDVLNRMHSGAADENSNTDMTRLMGRFNHVQAETGADVALIHHAPQSSVPGMKRPRGASTIDGWWDWKIAIDVDPENDTSKEIFFGTKAGVPHPKMTVKFFSHPVQGIRIVPVADQETDNRSPVIPFGRGKQAAGGAY